MKEKLQQRIEELKKENDQALQNLQIMDLERQKTINNILTRNGRILELEEMLKEK